MTTEIKAVLTHSAPNVKIFTFDGATLLVFRDVHMQAGPGITVKVIDANNPRNKEPDADGITAKYASGGNFLPGKQRLLVAAERAGIDLENGGDETTDWQQVQDLGDGVIEEMIAEFDEEAAEAEIVGFRDITPKKPGSPMDQIGDLLQQILNIR